ncbi:MAG: hypothetical protein CL853_09920, partial [Crocinitomicaceae bacterium]|nr:hypothetical protein [Crocinitomicaceae bacterium]
MKVIVKIALISILFLVPFIFFCQQDSLSSNNIAVVQLTTGKEIRGIVIYEDDLKIVLETGKNKSIEIYRTKIKSI